MDATNDDGPGRRSVVLHGVGARTGATGRRIARALEGAGLRTTDGRSAGPATAGDRCDADVLVIAGAPTSAIADVERLAAERHGRVLAILTAGGPTPRADFAWELLAAGASDVITWTADAVAMDVVARVERWATVDELIASPAVRDVLVGEGPAWTELLREVVEVARFTDASVLVTGESGTGKELVARLIHDLDRRADRGDLVVVDCTTVVPTLSGSEFFGHEKGAFTGATATRDGAFALADGGTLFLDEVGELPATLQAELLRVIQEGMYKRVGSNTWRTTRFRLICATNRDLELERAGGRFRNDLFFRIAEWQVRLPGLHERSSDIPVLSQAFLRSARPDRRPPAIEPAVRELIERRPYPGNVRDLRQLVGRIAKRHVGSGPITVGDVPPAERPTAERPTPPRGAGPWTAVGPGRPSPAPADDRADRDGVDRNGAGWEHTLDRAIRAAVAEGVTLDALKHRTAEVAIDAALESTDSVSLAASRLGVTPRALQLRRAGRRPSNGA